ncbi:MAG: pre-peptidase C-terminal domain-containing protein [Candidatus Cloacimonetes bacterium]|nr:pre-peptidase C-terminal domain-containing protein [Candidatus Cloacimonadota bacterium]
MRATFLLSAMLLMFITFSWAITETEPNGTWDATGVLLVQNGMHDGDIPVGNEVDFWKFESTQGDQIEINTCDGGTNFDTRLWIYDIDGVTELEYNDNDCGQQSRVTMTTPADGVYYFKVGGYIIATGHYEVELIGATPLPPPDFPEQAEVPDPSDGAVGVPVSGTMSWTFGADTDTYDLWLGTVGNMVQVVATGTAGADGTQGSYTYTGLIASTQYEWQLMLHNSLRNSTTGLLWTFTTACGNITTYPYTADFEMGGVLDPCWSQATDDERDWDIHTGSTPSNGTGPSSDHTTGTGYYAFYETTNPVSQGDECHLLTSCFDLTGLTAPTMEFYYHMYGANMGTLSIDIFDVNAGVWTDNLWTLSGDQGDLWQLGSFGIGGMGDIIQLRFRGSAGNGFASDMAIDDIFIFNQINPPNCSIPVYPLDSDVDVVEDGSLIWSSATGGPSGYQVWLGSDGGGASDPTNVFDGLDAGNVLSVDFTGLAYDTTYYWKIVPYNGNGDTTGCSIWSFTTHTNPTINTWP